MDWSVTTVNQRKQYNLEAPFQKRGWECSDFPYLLARESLSTDRKPLFLLGSDNSSKPWRIRIGRFAAKRETKWGIDNYRGARGANSAPVCRDWRRSEPIILEGCVWTKEWNWDGCVSFVLLQECRGILCTWFLVCSLCFLFVRFKILWLAHTSVCLRNPDDVANDRWNHCYEYNGHEWYIFGFFCDIEGASEEHTEQTVREGVLHCTVRSIVDNLSTSVPFQELRTPYRKHTIVTRQPFQEVTMRPAVRETATQPSSTTPTISAGPFLFPLRPRCPQFPVHSRIRKGQLQ